MTGGKTRSRAAGRGKISRFKPALTPDQLLKGAEENLSPEEKARRERQRISAGGFTDFQMSPDGDGIVVALADKLYFVDRPTGKLEELPTGDGPIVDPKFTGDTASVSYVRGHDVYTTDSVAGEEAVRRASAERPDARRR